LFLFDKISQSGDGGGSGGPLRICSLSSYSIDIIMMINGRVVSRKLEYFSVRQYLELVGSRTRAYWIGNIGFEPLGNRIMRFPIDIAG
jgi:hypothetical protein